LSAPALAHLKAQATDLFPDLKALLAGLQDPAQLRPARYADVRMARWHDGAVLAMGDCAHAMSPQLGQGANMALMDAWVLRNCLQTAWAESDQTSASPVAQWASAIASYSAQRQSHIRFYQQASFALTPLFQSNQRLLPALRDKLMHPMSKIPLVQQHNVATLAGLKTGWLWGRLTPPTS
jgi:2-polyprenyl-6-methoxyphenol hydroxylase-like FAD-dependent oxidoreductase